MAKQATVGTNDAIFTVLRTVLFDVPITASKRGLGIGEEDAIANAAWKGYDASMRLGSSAIDLLYNSGPLGGLLARSAPSLLRWQRLNSALIGAFFTALWRTVDLPTAADVNAVREELHTLAANLRIQGDRVEELVRALPRSRAPEKPNGRGRIAAVA
jgi:hypothetical protein